jgi:hypothetical protein
VVPLVDLISVIFLDFGTKAAVSMIQ